MDIQKLVAFGELLTVFQKVERVIYVPGTERFENDAEHSYNLTLVAWYLITSRKLNLNIDLVLKYALVHDFVEVYAGDTYVYSKDTSHLGSKHEREAAAAVRIQQEFPEFDSMHELIAAYEKREDPESRFVYALDKVVPLLVNYQDGGRQWKEYNVSLDMIRDEKIAKVKLSPEVVPYFEELLALLESEKDRLFT